MITKIHQVDERHRRKMRRLALIKERYRKLVLEPRKEIEFELEKDLEEEGNLGGINLGLG